MLLRHLWNNGEPGRLNILSNFTSISSILGATFSFWFLIKLEYAVHIVAIMEAIKISVGNEGNLFCLINIHGSSLMAVI